jgi:hypothetical protein
MTNIIAQAQTDSLYNKAFNELSEMLEGKQPVNFKKAVFIVENAYLENELPYQDFDKRINNMVDIAYLWLTANRLIDYPFKDSVEFAKNGAIFKVMTDTTFLVKNIVLNYPFSYDFEDFFGEKDWTKMFVSKLLITGKGNCHSMPYLYKILAEEMGTKAYLSFAPNHIYIKQRCKKVGWYNTELTSKMFPIDAWLMATGYVSKQAIIEGLYMDTLSQKQSVAACLIDLANAYLKKTNNYDDFVLKCCNLALIHYPNYANALLLKSKTLKKQFDTILSKNSTKHPKEVFHIKEAKQLYEEMEKTYELLIKYGYKEVPKEVYLQWLSELANNKEKYQNKQLNY